MTERAITGGADAAAPGRVSILIPSYLRDDDLRVTLGRTLAQSYIDKEVIVVDDGTPGDSIAKAAADFPDVRYLRTPRNLGLIGARNFGATQCSGEFILNLDDDSWLEQDDGIERIVAFMRSHPRCGVAALNIGLAHAGYLWSEDANPVALRTYKGCGNVYRREAVARAGDYITEFYRQGEEVERSLRILDAGFDVMSLPSVRVFHAQSAVNRNMARHVAFEAANYLRRELIRAPLWLVPFGVARALRWAVVHRREMERAVYLKELLGPRVRLLPFVRRHRAPVRSATYFRALRLR